MNHVESSRVTVYLRGEFTVLLPSLLRLVEAVKEYLAEPWSGKKYDLEDALADAESVLAATTPRTGVNDG